jgi:hypothetical protein
MNKRLTESQIMAILKQAEHSTLLTGPCIHHIVCFVSVVAFVLSK